MVPLENGTAATGGGGGGNRDAPAGSPVGGPAGSGGSGIVILTWT